MRFDLRHLREAIEAQAGESNAWDLELRGAGRVFVGRWENVPVRGADSYEFNPAAPPRWLVEQVPI